MDFKKTNFLSKFLKNIYNRSIGSVSNNKNNKLSLTDKHLSIDTKSSIDTFIITDCFYPKNDDKIFEEINKNIDPKILEKISNLQIYAYHVDKTGFENVECCICYRDDVKLAHLKCTHPVCTMCYNLLLDTKYYICPICQQNMERINVHKFYAIMVEFKINDYYGIGITYYPPIYEENTQTWKNFDAYYDIFYNTYQLKDFVLACKRLVKEDYYVFIPASMIEQITKIHDPDIKKIKILKIM